jgi:hypothetical protein
MLVGPSRATGLRVTAQRNHRVIPLGREKRVRGFFGCMSSFSRSPPLALRQAAQTGRVCQTSMLTTG